MFFYLLNGSLPCDRWLRLITNSPIHQFINSSIHQLTNSPTHQLTNSSTHQLTNSSTHQLTSSHTHQLIGSPTHQLTNLPTHQLKLLFLFYNTALILHSSEKIGCKVGKWPLFLTFHAFCSVYFQEQNLRLAPFSLSVLTASSKFFTPNYALLAPKTPLFSGYFALLVLCLMPRKGFVYTIAVYFYALLSCV